MAGTVGHKLMSGKTTKVDAGDGTQVDVRCQVSAYSLLFTFLIILKINIFPRIIKLDELP